MARHVRFHETGGPDVLKIEHVQTPEPGAGEVRIRARALGLNRAESMYRSGRYVIEPQFPATMGYEAAGVVDAVGAQVQGLTVGDSVSVVPAFMFDQYGLYGDLVLAPARAVVKNPEGLSWESAAATWMAYTTAWGALVDIADLGEGDVVVLGAASSSVGLAAIDIARSLGATPIALTRTEEKAHELIQAGAQHVLQIGVHDLEKEILALTDGKGARVVFDPVTGADFESLVKATSKDGIVFIYGALSHDATPIPVMHVLAKHITIRGYEFIEVTANDQKLSQAIKFIADGIAAGHFNAKIARVFPFEQIVDATRFLESNAQFGKVVVTID